MDIIKSFFLALFITAGAIITWFSSIVIGYFLAIVGGIILSVFLLFQIILGTIRKA